MKNLIFRRLFKRSLFIFISFSFSISTRAPLPLWVRRRHVGLWPVQQRPSWHPERAHHAATHLCWLVCSVGQRKVFPSQETRRWATIAQTKKGVKIKWIIFVIKCEIFPLFPQMRWRHLLASRLSRCSSSLGWWSFSPCSCVAQWPWFWASPWITNWPLPYPSASWASSTSFSVRPIYLLDSVVMLRVWSEFRIGY